MMSNQMTVEPDFPVPDDAPASPKWRYEVTHVDGNSDIFMSDYEPRFEYGIFLEFPLTHYRSSRGYQRVPSTRTYVVQNILKYCRRSTSELALVDDHPRWEPA